MGSEMIGCKTWQIFAAYEGFSSDYVDSYDSEEEARKALRYYKENYGTEAKFTLILDY